MNYWNAAGRHRLDNSYSEMFSSHEVKVDFGPCQSLLIYFLVGIDDHPTVRGGRAFQSLEYSKKRGSRVKRRTNSWLGNRFATSQNSSRFFSGTPLATVTTTLSLT